MRSYLCHLCYTSVGQRISICNYWNDPRHRDLNVNSSDYLALLNGERDNPNSTERKNNFLEIKKPGVGEGGGRRWSDRTLAIQSSLVSMTTMRLLLKSDIRKCSCGTLMTLGDMVLCSMAGVEHIWWHSNETVYHTCIEKWLE